jgi:mono/diheme cytochrome c family protein
MKRTISSLPGSILITPLMAGFLVLSVPLAFAQHQDPAAIEKGHLHHHHYAELEKVPEKARSRSNPLAQDPEASVVGRKLFEQHCAECHGNTAEGGKKAPSLRAEEVQQATPGTLFWILTNGVVRHGMPVWSKLPEPQRWQIVTYLKSLGPQQKTRDEGEGPLKDEHTQPKSLAPGSGQKP